MGENYQSNNILEELKFASEQLDEQIQLWQNDYIFQGSSVASDLMQHSNQQSNMTYSASCPSLASMVTEENTIPYHPNALIRPHPIYQQNYGNYSPSLYPSAPPSRLHISSSTSNLKSLEYVGRKRKSSKLGTWHQTAHVSNTSLRQSYKAKHGLDPLYGHFTTEESSPSRKKPSRSSNNPTNYQLMIPQYIGPECRDESSSNQLLDYLLEMEPYPINQLQGVSSMNVSCSEPSLHHTIAQQIPASNEFVMSSSTPILYPLNRSASLNSIKKKIIDSSAHKDKQKDDTATLVYKPHPICNLESKTLPIYTTQMLEENEEETAGSLWLLIHCWNCVSKRKCSVPFCGVMKKVLNHCVQCPNPMFKCKDSCNKARMMLSHYRECGWQQKGISSCAVCTKVNARKYGYVDMKFLPWSQVPCHISSFQERVNKQVRELVKAQVIKHIQTQSPLPPLEKIQKQAYSMVLLQIKTLDKKSNEVASLKKNFL